jgi:RimJ/RimL family protein N-acetyltransferase
MWSPIAAGGLILRPVGHAEAAALAGGDFSTVTAGDGWPHDDSLDGLRLGADGPGRSWLAVLDGLVIGDCGTHGAAVPGETVEIGYGLAAPYRGRGYGRQMVSALTRWLLGELGAAGVVAHTGVDNVPSRRVLESAGFRLTGEQDGQCRYEVRR